MPWVTRDGGVLGVAAGGEGVGLRVGSTYSFGIGMSARVARSRTMA